jgi:hypothetical protein
VPRSFARRDSWARKPVARAAGQQGRSPAQVTASGSSSAGLGLLHRRFDLLHEPLPHEHPVPLPTHDLADDAVAPSLLAQSPHTALQPDRGTHHGEARQVSTPLVLAQVADGTR